MLHEGQKVSQIIWMAPINVKRNVKTLKEECFNWIELNWIEFILTYHSHKHAITMNMKIIKSQWTSTFVNYTTIDYTLVSTDRHCKLLVWQSALNDVDFTICFELGFWVWNSSLWD